MNWRVLSTSKGKIGIVIALLWPLGRLVIWIVERAGDIDFIVHNKDSIIGVFAKPWFPLVFAIAGIAIVAWGAKRREIPAVSDYWRCPDGKLHEWTYWRGENTGIYMCKNCRSQVNKATLKAHTDQGPSSNPDDSRHITELEKPLPTLNPEHVAQRVAFVQQLQGLGAQFALVVLPASGYSLGGVFMKAFMDPATLAPVGRSPLLAQTMRLLRHDIEVVLCVNVSRYKSQVDALDSSLTDEQMQELCNNTRNLFQEYKRLLDEVLKLLMELRETLSVYADPWPDLIEHGLHEGYEELGRLLRDLRPKAPRNLQDLLPGKVEIGSFTSEFVQPHKEVM